MPIAVVRGCRVRQRGVSDSRKPVPQLRRRDIRVDVAEPCFAHRTRPVNRADFDHPPAEYYRDDPGDYRAATPGTPTSTQRKGLLRARSHAGNGGPKRGVTNRHRDVATRATTLRATRGPTSVDGDGPRRWEFQGSRDRPDIGSRSESQRSRVFRGFLSNPRGHRWLVARYQRWRLMRVHAISYRRLERQQFGDGESGGLSMCGSAGRDRSRRGAGLRQGCPAGWDAPVERWVWLDRSRLAR